MSFGQHEFLVVANRLPVNRVGGGGGPGRGGPAKWATSPGGLVSAMIPILERQPSAWIGWTGSADDAPEPFEHDGIINICVGMSADEIEAFYEGFSNSTIWPLYHDAIRTPEFHRHWWHPYRRINERFAEAAAQVAAPNAVVWVHDYHLQLVPGILRELRPDVRIGFFLHIPFPPGELFQQLPWRTQLIEGVLGADVVGYQTKAGAKNFIDLAQRYAGARVVSRTRGEIDHHGRRLRVDAFPISIDTARFEKAAADESIRAQAAEFRERLGQGRKIILGVDRLDYTKGIDHRLRAYAELLRTERAKNEDCVLIQTAVPTRQGVPEYVELRSLIDELVGSINGQYGTVGRVPIHYLRKNFRFEELVALYLAADIMLVTPLRDGMNLVAKEYAACRLDDTGVLVLSEFTGAANELTSALQVNPHDIDGMASTLHHAMRMPVEEQKRRMRALRKQVRGNDVFKWAESFLATLEKP